MSDLVYGSHDPNTVPRTVVVRAPGRGSKDEVVHVSPGLHKQRRRINEHAAGTLRRITDRRSADAR